MIQQKAPKQTRADEQRARKLVTLRDEGVCVRCRRVDPIHGVNFDHRLNRSQGGAWSPENGQLLCGSGTTGCHGWVTEHPAQAILDGWAVPGWADPASWPARRWLSTPAGSLRLCWVLLGDDCSVMEISEDEAQRLMKGGSSDGA